MRRRRLPPEIDEPDSPSLRRGYKLASREDRIACGEAASHRAWREAAIAATRSMYCMRRPPKRLPRPLESLGKTISLRSDWDSATVRAVWVDSGMFRYSKRPCKPHPHQDSSSRPESRSLIALRSGETPHRFYSCSAPIPEFPFVIPKGNLRLQRTNAATATANAGVSPLRCAPVEMTSS